MAKVFATTESAGTFDFSEHFTGPLGVGTTTSRGVVNLGQGATEYSSLMATPKGHGLQSKVISVGDTVWTKLPGLGEWARCTTVGTLCVSTIQANLKTFGAQRAQLDRVGSGTIGGVATAMYAATVDTDEPVNPSKSGSSAHVATHMALKVWVDSSGRIRQFESTLTFAGKYKEFDRGWHIRFWGFGTPAHIVPPPASQTTSMQPEPIS